MKILAFETSCDDTSIAIFDNEKLIAMETESQIRIHNETGGVVPEVAAREHANNIFNVLTKVLEKSNLKLDDIDYIGVTTTPGLLPSLLTGTTVAGTISTLLNKKIIPINHIEAHIFSNFLEREEKDIQFPLVCLTVSGGHNDIYYMKSMWDLEKIGTSGDDAGGEAFDKVAKMMGLGYPGGPIISKLSEEYLNINKDKKNTNKNLFPRVWLVKRGFDFSFSGLKSSVKREVDKKIENNEKLIINNDQGNINCKIIDELIDLKNKGKVLLTLDEKRELSYEFENAITEVLAWKLVNAAKEKKVKTVLLAGGVSANNKLKNIIVKMCKKEGLNFIYPKKNLYCMDNAAMVGINTYYRIKYSKFKNKIGIVKI